MDANRASPFRTFALALLSFLLVGILWTDFASLTPPAGLHGSSTAQRWFESLRGARIDRGDGSLEGVIYRAGGQLRLCLPNDDSWDEASRALENHPDETLLLSFHPVEFATGFWAFTRAHYAYRVEMSYGSKLTAPDRDEARAIFVSRAVVPGCRDLDPRVADCLRTTDVASRSVLWSGYLHNTISAAVFLCFLWSLRWIPRGPGNVRRMIERSRSSRNLCPRCRYPRAGLATEPCPECGHRPTPAPLTP